MKQLSKLRNIAARLAFFAVIAVAMFALSPKAFAATSIDIGGTVYNAPADLSSDASVLAGSIVWTDANTLTLTNATITNYVKIAGDITIKLSGTNEIDASGILSAVSGVNGALHVTDDAIIEGSGSLTTKGGAYQDGIYIGSSPDSNDPADKALTIETATVTATGGTSSAPEGKHGIDCGILKIEEGASVTGIGGTTGDSGIRVGGHGISVNKGQININDATINATGGVGNTTEGGGGDGLRIAYSSGSGSGTISNTTMTLTGGDAPKTSGTSEGGIGLHSMHDLTLENCTIISATGGDTGSTFKAGYGIYVHDTTLTLNNTTITTAKGGSGKSPKAGIGMTSGKLILENGSTINATGGDGTTNSAGSGVFGSVELNGTSKLTATGGNAASGGTIYTMGHGVYGEVTLNGSSQLTATGGNASGGTTNNTAGHGVYGPVTLNSDDIVLSAIGGEGAPPAHGLSQVATITTTQTLLDAFVGSSGFTTKVDLADPADPLFGTYNQNRYVYISKDAPPTPIYTPTLVQKPARDVIYPINLSLSNYERYIFNSSGLYSDFTGVWIHGFAIPESYYTLTMESDGTATVQLKDWYVRTLNYGEEYLIHLVFNSGYGITKFYR